MDLNYSININCSICELSIQYLLEKFDGCITYEWVEIENDFNCKSSLKNKKLNIKVDNSHYESIKRHLSKNIYDDGDAIQNIKVQKTDSSVTYVTNDLINCDKCHLIPFIAFNVSDNKLLGQLINKLNESFPMPCQFKFLKRINSSKNEIPQVLLAPQSLEFDLAMANKYLLQNNMEPNAFTKYVYFTNPLTKKHFEKYKQFWPSVFHPNSELEKLLLTNSGFSNSDVTSHLKLMTRAINIGKLSMSKKKIGTVIYDPATKTIVSEAYDCRESVNELCHAVIVALNRLSESQGGGQLPDACDQITKTAINPGGYLATGWDVYVSSQPCLMCSMALVHSRIGRLFYRYDNLLDGNHHSDDGVSRQSIFKLFSIKSLNHSFEVFEINT